jgi:hypothetical protein
MSKTSSQEIYEELTQICAEFSQRPQHHGDRLTLLTYPTDRWVDMLDVVSSATSLYQRLERLAARDARLMALHVSTPDEQWSLVNFYCEALDAVPATALLLKRAHVPSDSH